MIEIAVWIFWKMDLVKTDVRLAASVMSISWSCHAYKRFHAHVDTLR